MDDLAADILFAADKWTAINHDWRMSEKLENACIFIVNDQYVTQNDRKEKTSSLNVVPLINTHMIVEK
jgi:uncharacterized membrane protein YsdA (DUF1294 family)